VVRVVDDLLGHTCSHQKKKDSTLVTAESPSFLHSFYSDLLNVNRHLALVQISSRVPGLHGE
jgi:hypothetical protein